MKRLETNSLNNSNKKRFTLQKTEELKYQSIKQAFTSSPLPKSVYTIIYLHGFHDKLEDSYESMPINRVWHLRFKEYYGNNQTPKITGNVIKSINSIKDSKDPKKIIYELMIDSKFLTIFR
eukprot:NODE_266_length_11332_cov_0.554705.p9 type:complete len:121 gc:universal NODE_266_length_11332_cov_0.554705:6470-6832(+)